MRGLAESRALLTSAGCVYYASMVGGTPDEAQTRSDAQGLLGCADTTVDKINGLDFKDAGYGVCISDGDGQFLVLLTEIVLTRVHRACSRLRRLL